MKVSAKVLGRSRIFWGVIAAFFVANFLSALLPKIAAVEPGQETSIGFPFPFYVSHGVTGASEFYISGLLLDLVVPPTVAISVVWIGLLIRGTDD